MVKQVLKSGLARRAAAGAIAAYLRVALGTTRWTIEGEANLDPFAAQVPVIVAFWHECLPLMPAVWLRVRRANPVRGGAVLVSRHQDGMLIGDAMARFGVSVVQGSGTQPGDAAYKRARRGGAAALVALARRLREGDAIVVTPDGPRGPLRVAAPGVLQLAALSGAPVLPVAARVRWRVTLKSWDRMILPLPFGRGAMVCLAPFHVAREGAEAARTTLEAALTAAADRAEVLGG
jgi:lysophospholipid acyltransferase (LPLAT)-like uncharacterized protein